MFHAGAYSPSIIKTVRENYPVQHAINTLWFWMEHTQGSWLNDACSGYMGCSHLAKAFKTKVDKYMKSMHLTTMQRPS